jgi:hypothetical protein
MIIYMMLSRSDNEDQITDIEVTLYRTADDALTAIAEEWEEFYDTHDVPPYERKAVRWSTNSSNNLYCKMHQREYELRLVNVPLRLDGECRGIVPNNPVSRQKVFEVIFHLRGR